MNHFILLFLNQIAIPGVGQPATPTPAPVAPSVPNSPTEELAAKIVDTLQNPFALKNAAIWLAIHGLKISVIVAVMLLLRWMMHKVSNRLANLVDSASTRESARDRQNRIATLSAVLRGSSSAIILLGGGMMILEEFGIAIAPLLGGVAIVGLAVAFGTQNLVKDYFTGMMILFEDQYGVSDVVQIGGLSGQVERITLRVTVLRDLDGTAHFVPHGQITTVSNRTHSWSRAVFDVTAPNDADVGAVMEALMQIGREARTDPTLGPNILADPKMLGVEQLLDATVLIRFYIRTLPMQQWNVKHALLLKIKQKLGEMHLSAHVTAK